MKEFLLYFFGNYSTQFYIAGALHALLGALIYKTHAWLKHKKTCEVIHCHEKFKPIFWIRDNWLDLLITLIVVFVAVRFSDILVPLVGDKISKLFNIGEIPQLEVENHIAYFPLFSILAQYAMHKLYRRKE